MSKDDQFYMVIGLLVVAGIVLWILWEVTKGPRNRGD